MASEDDYLLNLAHEIRLKEQELAELRADWARALANLKQGSSGGVSVANGKTGARQASKASSKATTSDDDSLSYPELVLGFLRRHPGRLFTAGQIAEGIGKADKVTTVSSTLQRLLEQEKIERPERGKFRLVLKEGTAA